MTPTETHTNSKKRLSLFSFGSHSSNDSKSSLDPQLGTSPKNNQLSSPINSPVYSTNQTLSDNPDSNIFERSVQDTINFDNNTLPKCNRCSSRRSRSCTHSSLMGVQPGSFLKSEDFIAPALDATTSILSDKDTNLDDVEMIYSNRRNSSVIGLNMALGKPFTPSRKNSTYSFNSSIPHPPSVGSVQPQQSQSPISPPKLTSSKSSLSFYSYADMISNDEFARRPSFKQSSSQGIIPTNNNHKNINQIPFSKSPSFIRKRNQSTSSQLSKQLSNIGNNNNLNKFLISPESSDSEDQDFVSLRSNRKSICSAHSNGLLNDNESLISSSVGDCIRQSKTEINGN